MPASISGSGTDLLGLGGGVERLYRQTELRYGVGQPQLHLRRAGPTRAAAGPSIWEGMDWTREILLSRLVWLAAAVGLALLAALFFDRFDTARWSGRVRSPRGPLLEAATETGATPA